MSTATPAAQAYPTYADALHALVEADERVLVVTAENRGNIRKLPPILGDRFLDVGICEQTMIGMGAGLALRGRVPVMHALATFLVFRPYEFIRDDLGIPCLPGKLVGAVPGVLSDANGPTHQALEDVALMRGIPNMHVFCPADGEDLALGLPHVVGSPNPTYIRHNERPAPVRHAPFELGRAEVVLEGEDIGILVYGALFTEALEAARLLAAQGRSVRLVNMRMLKPVDADAIEATVRRCGLVVTIEDAFKVGGLHTILAETCLARGVLPRRTLAIAFDERWFTPALLPAVLEVEGLTAPRLAERIAAALA
ncbi:MAG: transketolase C-terminal domain-containing protein [Gemmatimonadales bacterium]|nr:transketolase C-terminal domain-containing protein [Gemmatimonadales bacterium]